MSSVIHVLSSYLVVHVPDSELPYALEDERGELVHFFASCQEALDTAVRFEADLSMKEELKVILEELNDTMEDVIALVDRIAKHDSNLYEKLYKHASEFEYMVFTELHD